jgi:hypothetical protein
MRVIPKLFAGVIYCILIAGCQWRQIKYRTAIPLDDWLVKGTSWLDDNDREHYSKLLRGEYPKARISSLLKEEQGALQCLFFEVEDPSLDGERSETLTANLVFALVVVGDEEYARALSQESSKRQKLIARRVLIRMGGLRGKVPKTEAICRRYYPKK